MKKTLAILLTVLLLAAMLTGCGSKKVNFTVTYQDGTSKSFELDSKEETLATALVKAGLISQDEADAGYVTTVDGVLADYEADEAWWKLVDANGADSQVGITDVKTADAEGYGFVYTIGF